MACLFTATAEAGLEAITDYIALDNPARAISFVLEIRTRCDSFELAPERNILVREFDDVIRRDVLGNYLVFYTVEGLEVVVLRVLHVARHITESDFDDTATRRT